MCNYEELNIRHVGSESDPFTAYRYRQFYRLINKGARKILDIGCNTGRGGEVLKQYNPDLQISGLDVVKERLDKLPGAVYAERIYGPCTNIPVEDQTFDVVVAGEVIEHLYPCDVDKALSEMFRVLRVGGQALLTTPNPGDIKRKLRGESILHTTHVSQHFPDCLRLRMRLIGFSRVRLYGSGRVSRYLGGRFPALFLYGSYLVSGDKY